MLDLRELRHLLVHTLTLLAVAGAQEEGAAFVPKGAANWTERIAGPQTVSLAGRDDDDEADSGKPQQTSGSFHILEQAGPGTTEELEVDEDVEAKSLAYLADPARHTAPWSVRFQPRRG